MTLTRIEHVLEQVMPDVESSDINPIQYFRDSLRYYECLLIHKDAAIGLLISRDATINELHKENDHLKRRLSELEHTLVCQQAETDKLHRKLIFSGVIL